MATWSRYLSPTATERQLGLVCLGAGLTDGMTEWLPERVLNCYALVLVTGGSGRLRWDAHVAAPVNPPAAFWLFPGVPHAYGPAAEGWQVQWVLIDGAAVHAYERLGFLARAEPLIALDDAAGAAHVMNRILRALRSDDADPTVTVAALCHELLVTVHASRLAPTAPGVLAALRRHASEPMTVADHARRAGCTPDELRVSVRAAAGCTPKEFLLRVRLERAQQLLADTDLGVDAVARRVGYADAAYFSRMFSRRVGISPSRFRAQQHLT